jgi:hypothetical protein
MQDINEGMPSYPLHLADENKHLGKCLGHRLQIKGHGWGLGLLGIKAATILEGLLICQGLNVIPGCLGPVLESPQGPPHVPFPKGKKLEGSHRKLGDLVSVYIPSRLFDGTAELLDDVIREVSKYIQGGDHLAIVEFYRCSLAEEKDCLEHFHCVRADYCLNEGQVPLRVFCFFSIVIIIVVFDSQFIRVDAPFMPRTATGFKGFILSARHQHLLLDLRAGSSCSCNCKASSQVAGHAK